MTARFHFVVNRGAQTSVLTGRASRAQLASRPARSFEQKMNNVCIAPARGHFQSTFLLFL